MYTKMQKTYNTKTILKNMSTGRLEDTKNKSIYKID